MTYQASLPPVQLPVATYLCWIPLFLICRRFADRPWLVALLWFGTDLLNGFLATWWLITFTRLCVQLEGWFSWYLILANAAWMAGPFLILGYLLSWKPIQASRLFPVIAACLFAVILANWPKVFPGGHYLGLTEQLWFIQWAEVGGIPLLIFWIILINVLIAEFLWQSYCKKRLQLKTATVTALALTLLLGFGAWRYGHVRAQEQQQLEEGDSLKVCLIQAAMIPPGLHGKTDLFPEGFTPSDVTMIPLSKLALQQVDELDLLLWPEVPQQVAYLSDSQARAAIQTLQRSSGVPLAFCSSELVDPEQKVVVGEQPHTRQSIHLLDGLQLQSTHKKRLIPFSDYLPFESFLPMREWMPDVRQVQPDRDFNLLELDEETRLGGLVCYDDVFPEIARAWREAGATQLLTMTNDSWFLDSRGSDIRLAAAVLCAVESRLPNLRIANSGPTLVIRPSGELDGAGAIGLFEHGFMSTSVPTKPIDKLPRLPFAWLATAFCLGWLLMHYYRQRQFSEKKDDLGGDESR